MSDYCYGSYIGPIESLFGRCAQLRPCKETFEDPNDTKMVMAQFDLPVHHPSSRKPLHLNWHRFRQDEFQELKPLPE